MASMMEFPKGSRVWIRDPHCVWKKATLAEDLRFDNPAAKIVHDDSQHVEIVNFKDCWPHLRNPDILLGVNDLTLLSYLHEPAVLHNLSYRFLEQRTIYTYCGIVLVAINPYADISLYNEGIMKQYSGQSVREKDPHIFAVAEEAISDLARCKKNQSIIVSGESGAGKTVSAKYTMRYFAYVCSTSHGSNLSSSRRSIGATIEEKVLRSNVIMEAIGNAKTIRNDNSSRFGKFTQIFFSDRIHIAGASMRTYLLEKSRLVFQARSERNYHIFYQLCSQATSSDYSDLQLKSATLFDYTFKGETSQVIGVNDASDFFDTLEAMTILGFSSQETRGIFSVLSAVLHLGNLSFVDDRVDSCQLDASSSGHFTAVVEILKLSGDALKKWMISRPIRAVHDSVIKPLSTSQAYVSRDALAKAIYSTLFGWIVNKINLSLKTSTSAELFIGVLDIYGFETFDLNSFEQFCINYANEKLQQQFNQHVFKLEQDEYLREGITWSLIDFADNQPCIDLIEANLGILDMLDEECKVPKGNDDEWLTKMAQSKAIKGAKNFEIPKLMKQGFIIKHFAGNVDYNITGFVEKNRDTVNEELVNVFRQSKLPFLAEMFMDIDENANSALPPSAATKRNYGLPDPKHARGASGYQQYDKIAGAPQKVWKKSVALQFRESLKQLSTILNSTTPHYVRCIKPNDSKESFQFDSERAVQQLRACGVLETVRISAAGYPSRWSYEDFYNRWRVLQPNLKRATNFEDMRSAVHKICFTSIADSTMFALGKTKVFFRIGQVALLEEMRTKKLRSSCILIQKTVRGFIARARYLRMRNSIITMQATIRAFIAWRRYHYLRMHRAVIRLQAAWRCYRERKAFVRVKKAVLIAQCHYRGRCERLRLLQLRFDQKARVIQRYFRGYQARVQYRKKLRQILLVQCCVRRWLAKRELKKLKIEARSVKHFQDLNKGLENKIFSLQRKLDDAVDEKRHLEKKVLEGDKFADRLQTTSAELEDLRRRFVLLEIENERNSSLAVSLREQLDAEKTAVHDLHNLLDQRNRQLTSNLDELEKVRGLNQQLLEEQRNEQFRSVSAMSSGYSSRVTLAQPEHEENGMNFDQQLPSGSGPDLTSSAASILLRQQGLISEQALELQRTKAKLESVKRAANLNAGLAISASGDYNDIRLSQLEIEHVRLKDEMAKLVKMRTPAECIGKA